MQKSADFQGVSVSTVIRQWHCFGLLESDYYRVLDIAKHQKVEPKMVMRQSFSLSDMLMNPNTTVSDVLVSIDPNMVFAKAMRSRPNLLARLFGKIEKKLKEVAKKNDDQ